MNTIVVKVVSFVIIFFREPIYLYYVRWHILSFLGLLSIAIGGIFCVWYLTVLRPLQKLCSHQHAECMQLKSEWLGLCHLTAQSSHLAVQTQPVTIETLMKRLREAGLCDLSLQRYGTNDEQQPLLELRGFGSFAVVVASLMALASSKIGYVWERCFIKQEQHTLCMYLYGAGSV